ncbi:hypothetical protein CVD25_09450 [Bacillus canaveralius]|uniref:Uncharacterized protein n=1 Tax=Bacillus canaveralius TaxID=1403243 RepID=A0A2N5GKM4_9BACI|nr:MULTISPECIES: hypothetical protein [Bacillus]PLR81450.1 hypothetical protein CVD23_18710 [Bacillus sp. V33-4]PLR82061.1 hypothetical protein CU635_12890 [Bacillus canaveralius]PLR98033.1 hypothetical protein CVD25_09450 [Bacillus canaveralius]RSK54387.1 hypothetical protein EJA13_05505 [Bacillus canaveralius]
MGYILPITNYQYAQYAEREIGVHYDPFILTPVERINKLGKAYQTHENSAVTQRQMGDTRFTPVPKVKRNEEFIDKTYAELSGKGRNFNKIV